MKIVQTSSAPSAIGPYSQAIIANGFLYSSGVIPLNISSGMIEAETIEAQTKLVLSFIDAILSSQELEKENVVKTTIFLKDMNDFPKVNQIYSNFFGSHKPARSTVEVARLPKDAKIEIEFIAQIN